ncbi:putative T7SS-secreted protein [Amycolatopsis vastitatis]|uniref:Putative T7SS secretion signal domain-containing protein n=1 Tax=Amycolatopsis vastitatis TaxID=1905142 RepID=A0A229T554_9PSEU|nr:ADP-ribosyltransferase domain-containing protein [Amycolatopsis vastitatis]OXM66396.1 hypothetical protein CF165_19925 [Amycolatopsis vastitatis]
MGVWEFLDEIEEGAEDGLEAVGRGVGEVADKAAHVAGDGLDALGLHSAAEAVDGFGDSVADTLGAEVGEAQLGQTDDPAKLVHGDAGALKAAAGHLAKFGAAFGKTADGLRRIDTAHWTGEAADKFRAQYRQHPTQWSDAAEACTRASAALTAFGDVVQWAQQQAGEAVRLFAAAKQQSEQARAAYNQQVITGGQPGAFTDPGAEGLGRAQQLLNDARTRRNTAGDRAKAALEQATAAAPAEPRFTDRLLAEGADLLQEGGDGLVHFYGGIAKGVGGILKFGRSLNPLDPYNVTHPAEYLAGLSGTAAGLLHTVNHPLDMLKGMLGDGWGSDPFEAMGKLVPNVALALATDGAGAAGERAAAVGEEAAESAAVTAGRDAAEVAAERPAGFVEHPPPAEDFGPAGHDFGPAGHGVPDEPPPSFHEKPDIADRLDHFDEDGFDYSDPLGHHGDGPVGEHGGPFDDVAHPDDAPTSSHSPAPASEPVPPPDYGGDPHFRTTDADHAALRDAYPDYHLRAQEVQKIVAEHPELAGIPEADLVGVRGYTSNSFYEEMNKGLREGDPALIDRYDAHARSVTSGLNQMPTYEGEVSRGIQVTGQKLADLIDRYEPGAVVEEPAFFSTDRIKSFPGNVQFEVESVTGRDIRNLSTHSGGEAEVLFPPGTKFQVKERQFDEALQQWLVKLRDVS